MQGMIGSPAALRTSIPHVCLSYLASENRKLDGDETEVMCIVGRTAVPKFDKLAPFRHTRAQLTMAGTIAALAVSSSIIAVLQLTGTILWQGYSYIAQLTAAPKELQALLNELSSLSGILSALKCQLDHGINTPYDPRLLALTQLDASGGPLAACTTLLQRVQKRIRSLERSSSMGGYLVAPRYVKEMRYDIEGLERLKSVLQLALFADQM